jgi:hypothetical protein
MKEHPDRQPRRSIPVNGGYDDDRETNDEFESERIDASPLMFLQSDRRKLQ